MPVIGYLSGWSAGMPPNIWLTSAADWLKLATPKAETSHSNSVLRRGISNEFRNWSPI